MKLKKEKLSSVKNSLMTSTFLVLGDLSPVLRTWLLLYLRFEITYFLPYFLSSPRRAADRSASANRQHD